jgi:hypothetical protein
VASDASVASASGASGLEAAHRGRGLRGRVDGRRCGGVGRRGGPGGGAAGRGPALRGQCGARAGGGWRAVADAKREKKQIIEKKEPDVFKYLIFGGQGAGRRKYAYIFGGSVTAAENKLIFGGLLLPPKIPAYFRRPRPDRRK